MAPAQLPPEFLVAGHITRDLVDGEERAGGTACYAAVVAARLGLRTAVLTAGAGDLVIPPPLASVTVVRRPAEKSTVFEHRWFGRRREQYVRARADTIGADGLPGFLLQASIVLFGPVIYEIGPELLRAFPGALRGATVQGWLRRLAEDQHVEPLDAAAWDYRPIFASLDAVFLSDEDLGLEAGDARCVLDEWAAALPLLVVTRGYHGAAIAVNGRWHSIGAMPAAERDGTGAGDAFAAAFLIRYHETADPGQAARFATATAGFVVEAPGVAGAPDRAQVEERLAALPDVILRPAEGPEPGE